MMANLKRFKGKCFWRTFFQILDAINAPNNVNMELYWAIDALKANGLYPDNNGRIREL